MLGPESPVYDPLPNNTSIRILYLAPGEPEDEIFCFLYDCDLDQDHDRFPGRPRPFENLCIAFAQSPGAQTESRKFMLHVDSYIHEEQAEERITPRDQEEVEGEFSASQDHTGPLQENHHIEQIEHKSEHGSQTSGQTVEAEIHNSIALDVNSDQEVAEHRSELEAEDGSDSGGSDGELDDDMWDLMQLMKLHQAGGALDKQVRRHPFQRFTALSYVWGSVESPRYIIMNGFTKFWVTNNLSEALRSLRQPDQARPLWIDAICINQNDPAEKKIQIALMKRVYQQAQQVIAYVPQTKEDTENLNILMGKIIQAGMKCDEAIQSGRYLEDDRDSATEKSNDELGQDHATNIASEQAVPDRITSEASDSGKDTQSEQPRIEVKNLPLKPTGTCIEDYDLPGEDDPAWLAWRHFFASPYFRRIWILQEYALAKEVYFRLGQGQGKADMMLLAMHYVRSMSRLINGNYIGRGENSELTQAAIKGWNGLERMTLERIFASRLVQKEQGQELIDKIATGLAFDATDPRDKIFAVLGLAADGSEYQQYVSYEEKDTYDEVYKRFARSFVEKGYCYQVLHMACKTSWATTLPTWIPNWSTSTEAALSTTIQSPDKFKAGGSEYLDARVTEDHSLSISGITFDVIDFTTDAFVPFSKNAPLGISGLRLQDFFETLSTTVSQICAYIGEELLSIIMEIFYIVSMRPDRLELGGPEPDSNATNDLLQFRTLIARLMLYMEIPDHDQHKVTFGALPEEDRSYIERVMQSVVGRRFCVTRTGKIGLIPRKAQIGDLLAVFVGAPVPFVLRPIEGKGQEAEADTLKLVGDAYVNVVMQGEALNGIEKVQRLLLV